VLFVTNSGTHPGDAAKAMEKVQEMYSKSGVKVKFVPITDSNGSPIQVPGLATLGQSEGALNGVLDSMRSSNLRQKYNADLVVGVGADTHQGGIGGYSDTSGNYATVIGLDPEMLAHEIGHNLGLKHSTDYANDPDKNNIMNPTVTGDAAQLHFSAYEANLLNQYLSRI